MHIELAEARAFVVCIACVVLGTAAAKTLIAKHSDKDTVSAETAITEVTETTDISETSVSDTEETTAMILEIDGLGYSDNTDKYEIIDDNLVHNKLVDGATRADIQCCYLDNIKNWVNGCQHIGFADLDLDGIPELLTWGKTFKMYRCDLENFTVDHGRTLMGIGVDSELTLLKDNISGATAWYSVLQNNEVFSVKEIMCKEDFDVKELINVTEKEDAIYYFNSEIEPKTYDEILMSYNNQYIPVGASNVFVKSKEINDSSDYTHIVSVLLDEYYK